MRRVLLWNIVLAAAISLAACAQKGEEKKGDPAPEAEQREADKDEAPVPAPEAPVAEEPASPSATDPGATPTAEPAPEQPAEAATEAAPTFDLTGTVAAVEKFIPDAPVIVAAGDLDTLEEIFLKTMGGGLLILPEAEMKALQDTLGAYHLAKLGVTVRGIGTAVAFVGPTGDSGVLIKADVEFSDKLRGEEVGGYRLINLIPDPKAMMFEIPDYGVGIYVAAAVNLETYLQLVAERAEPKPDRLKEFTEMLGRDKGAWLAVAINFAHPIVAMAWPPDVPFKRPDKGLIQFTTGGLAVEIEAAAEVLDSIDNIVTVARAKGRAFIDMSKAKLDSMPVGEGTMIIVADAYYDTLFKRLAPKRDGNRMRMELTMDLWGATPLIGILAAVAIPTFIKYTKKAKSSEATNNLTMLRVGATEYFCTPHVDQEGNMIPNQFPPDAGPTPETGCCAGFGGPDADGNDSCDADPERFAGQTWTALRFMPTDEHRYAYQFTSNGKSGSEAEFMISAYGDLDCDGVRSTFQLTGKGIAENGECDVEIGPMYMESELE